MHAFVSMLEVEDQRFDLSIYGFFLKEIPRRMGSNEALDASVGALTLALPCVHTKQPTAPALEAYGQALRSLRLTLSNHDDDKTADTLCAMYLVVITQVSTYSSPTREASANATRRAGWD
jgi:hypothetical protein